MTANPLTGTYASLVTLTGVSYDPFTIAATGLLNAGLRAEAIGTAWTIANNGSVLGSGIALRSAGTVVNAGSVAGLNAGPLGFGIYLASGGGAVTNQSTGRVSGFHGIRATSTLTVENYGAISGYAAFIAGSKPYGAGVFLDAGGSVTNHQGGSIGGGAGIYNAGGGALTVVNDGAITGVTYSSGRAIVLGDSGGSVTNLSHGTISGYQAIAATGTLTVVNAGGITGFYGALRGTGIYLRDGGAITNQSGATISGYQAIYSNVGGALTLVNAGVIVDPSDISQSTGVSFRGANSVITNQSGGSISGFIGVDALADGATILNAGGITAFAIYDTLGIAMQGGGLTNLSTGLISGWIGLDIGGTATVDNYGSISGRPFGPTGTGIFVDTTGSGVITNHAGATISGPSGIGGEHAVTVVNGGAIKGAPHYAAGISLDAGGGVTNLSGGTISGFQAVYGGKNGALSVVNDGGIAGSDIGNGIGRGVSLGAAGSVTNQTDGTIGGYVGIRSSSPGGLTVVNQGGISGNQANLAGAGIYATGGGITNQIGGLISGYRAVYNYGTTALSVVNAGGITGTDRGADFGISEGAVTNQSGGTISGKTGIFGRSALTIVNSGEIRGNLAASGNFGVYLQAGGAVTNANGGVITGRMGINAQGAMTVVNAGSIVGSLLSVYFAANVTNRLVVDPGAYFSGGVVGGNPVGSSAVSTLEFASAATAGTVSGLTGKYFGFTQTNIDSGAVWTLTGANYFDAGTTLTNAGSLTLANASVTDAGDVVNDGSIRLDPLGASTATFAGLTGTGQVSIGEGGTVVTQGSVAAGQTIDFAGGSGWLGLAASGFSGQIAGFVSGDTIDLTGVTDATLAHIVNVNTLEVERGGNPAIDLTLDPGKDYAAALFAIGNDDFNGYNTVTTDLACFAAGTRLDTPDGPVAVDALRIGDLVLTADGSARPVRWIGWRHLDLRRHPDPGAARPIRIMADAVGQGEPRRDVLLSPAHAVLIDGALIPVGLLVNGATIRQESDVASVTYFHVELDAHDVLLAEGMAAEVYLDTGNRGIFQNAPRPLLLHPDLTTDPDPERRHAGSCAPFLDDPDRVAPVWRTLARRAVALGHALPVAATTRDADLGVECDGRRLRPVVAGDGLQVFVLPARSGALHLVSRATAPNATRPWMADRRNLGVFVRRLTLRHAGAVEIIPLDHPLLTDGWWGLEDGGRWTNGDAVLPLTFQGPATLEISYGALPGYLILTVGAVGSGKEPVRRAKALRTAA